MSDVKKQWKERENLSISELEDIWFANRNLEMAKYYILAVKDFQKISLEEKLEFLYSVFYEGSNLTGGIEDRKKLNKYIKGPLLNTLLLFFFPEWKQEPCDNECGLPYARLILFLLYDKEIYSHAGVSAGQIKKFVHSYLNSVKKEEMDSDIAEILINNLMFEELVNYNFVSDEVLRMLWNFVFKQTITSAYGYHELFVNPHTLIKEGMKKARELLWSWDKVEKEKRHALSTLWTLLAKRGDLEKIFGAEKTGEVKKVE